MSPGDNGTASPANGTAPSAPARSRGRPKAPESPTVTCAVCRRPYTKITPEHLRSHGLTTSRYSRMFAAPLAPPRPGRISGRSAPAEPPDAETLNATVLRQLADQLASMPSFAMKLAPEVGEALFTSSARDRLRLSLVSVFTARMVAHGEAVAKLEAIKRELLAPWRINAGGENGTPTPTKDLIAMGHLLLAEVKSGEEQLIRTAKAAIDEEKSRKQIAGMESRLSEGLRFTGGGEKIPVPDNLTPAERESVRVMFGALQKMVDEQRRTKTPLVLDAKSAPATLPPPVAAAVASASHAERVAFVGKLMAPPSPLERSEDEAF